MTFIVPTGTVDGLNTTFTVPTLIYSIDEVVIDGVIYTGGITILGNTFTLSDAPVVSISVDYITEAPLPPPPVPGVIQLSAAFTKFTELKKDTSDIPSSTFISWCDYINKFMYRYVLGVDPGRYIKEYQFTASSGTAVYALPSDFRDIAHFGTGIYFYDSNNNVVTDRRLARTGFGSSTTGYFLQGTNINLTPPNWNTSQVFTLRYVPTQTTLQSITDYFTLSGISSGAAIIPEEFIDLVVKALDVRYTIWDEEPAMESYSDARFDRDLTEIAKEIYREASQYNLEDMTPFYGLP